MVVRLTRGMEPWHVRLPSCPSRKPVMLVTLSFPSITYLSSLAGL